MAQGKFAQEFYITAPREQVFPTFSLPHHQIAWHPLMRQVHDFAELQDADGHTIYTFWYDEVIKMLGVNIANKVRSRFTIFEPNARILLEGFSVMNIHVQAMIVMRDRGNGTHISETCTITVPFFVKGYVLRTARQAHKAMFEALKRQMERT